MLHVPCHRYGSHLPHRQERRVGYAGPHQPRRGHYFGLHGVPPESLHVIASMQPYHCIDDGRWAEKRIGPERAKGTYAFRALLDSGAVLAFGSDWDVAPMQPLMGIYAA